MEHTEPAVQIFDRALLPKRLMGDEELAHTICTMFIEDTPQQLSAIEQALEQGDLVEVGKLAHRLKGAAANLTAVRVQQIAHEMERAGNAGHSSLLVNLLPQLQQAFSKLKVEMGKE